MSWSVTFALSVPAWGLDIPVRVLEGSGNACFESAASLDDVFQGLPYIAGGSTFTFPVESDWSQGRCGNDFTVGQIEAIVSSQCLPGNTRRIQIPLKRRNPCELRFTRTGRFGSSPERGAPR